MPYSFGAEPKVYKELVDNFHGVDFASSEVKIAPNRSPNAVNIICDSSGKTQKRTGYKTVVTASGKVNGIHRLKTANTETVWVHIGTVLYAWNMTDGELDETAGVSGDVLTQVRTGLNDYRSVSYQFHEKLYILDGLHILACGDLDDSGTVTVDTVENYAYVPWVTLNLKPASALGGVSNEKINLLTTKRKVSYLLTLAAYTPPLSIAQLYMGYTSESYTDAFECSSATGIPCTSFQLPSAPTTGSTAKLEYLFPDGVWFDPTDATDVRTAELIRENIWTEAETFAISSSGRVVATHGWFGVSSSSDCVRITYEHEIDNGGADKIHKSTVACLFGLNGNTTRLFLGGNVDYPNILYWSGSEDFTYMPDLNYKYVGQESSMIMGFSKVQDSLVIHKDGNGQDETVFIAKYTLDSSGEEMLSLQTGIAGIGAASRWGNHEFFGEPVFISPNGLEAITTLSVTSERYAQNRSHYVRPQLSAMDLSEAVGIEHDGYYYLAVGNKCFVADSKRKVYAQNAPQSDYQYEWYYFENIPARVWWEYKGRLYFGTADGQVKRFYKSSEYQNSTTDYVYKDDSTAVTAVWDTPYFHFGSLGNYKNLKGLWVMLAPNIRSGIDILYRYRGSLANVKEQNVRAVNADIFDFDDIDFTRFTFNVDASPMVIATNRKLKKFMTVQFRFKNANAEPFCLYGFEARYTISSKFKG